MEDTRRIYVSQQVAKRFETMENRNFFNDAQEDCLVIENGIILPAKKVIDCDGFPYFKGGVADDKGKFVTASQTWRGTKHGSLTEGYKIGGELSNIPLKEVLYAGLLNNHFGHFLLESTNRLWYWIENRDKNLDIAFLLTKHQPIPKQFWEFMEICNIPKSKIHFIKQPLRCNKIYIPSVSNILGHSYTNKFLTIFQEAAKNVPAGKNDKIYLSRTKFYKRKSCFGEKYIEKLFSENGYTVIYPEQLSLQEQISVLKGASEVAGVVGTNMHLEVFSHYGVKSIVLNRSDMPIAAQTIIHQALNADWYIVGANMNAFPVGHSAGPNLLGITNELSKFCQEKGLKFDKKLVGYIKPSDCRRFVKEYLQTYTQDVYNQELRENDALTGERLLFMQKAFIPFKRMLKQRFKKWRQKFTGE